MAHRKSHRSRSGGARRRAKSHAEPKRRKSRRGKSRRSRRSRRSKKR